MFNKVSISLFIVAVSLIVPSLVDSACWDTGCQLNSWTTTGCEQYNRYELKKITCNGGYIYTCCDKQESDNIVPTGGGAGSGNRLNKHGDLTWYKLGLTACGKVYSDSDNVAALAFGHFTTPNPNQDPLCGKRIKIKDPSTQKEMTVSVVDKCEACTMNDVDVSSGAFKKLRPLSVGRFKVEWGFV